MRVASFNGERRLAALAARLYEVDDKHKPDLMQAMDALRHANPQLDLSKPGQVPKGTPILVPDLAGTRPTREAVPLERPMTNVAAGVAGSLRAIRDVVIESHHRESEEIKSALSMLKSRDLLNEAKQDPELNRRIPQLAKAMNARADEAKKRATQIQSALELLAKDLDEFTRKVG